MAGVTDPAVLALAEPGETAWEGRESGTVVFQCECPDPECNRGLLYAPARLHPACAGTGWVTRTVRLPPPGA